MQLINIKHNSEQVSFRQAVLQGLQQDSDHRVVAAALNGLQSQTC